MSGMVITLLFINVFLIYCMQYFLILCRFVAVAFFFHYSNTVLYYLQVTEAPGFYLWHDHSTANMADGLLGGIRVQPRVPVKTVWSDMGISEESVLVLTDWWHMEANVIAMMANRWGGGGGN